MKTCDDIKTLIQAFVDGELPAGENNELQNHLKSCSNCRTEFESAKKLNKMLADNLTKVELPPYFEAKLWARIENEKRVHGKQFWPAKLVPIMVVSMCLVVIATVIFRSVNTAKPEIYIVSPETNSIVPAKDVTISAAFYNKSKNQKAQLVLNNEVVVNEESDQMIYTSDKDLQEGYYKIKIQIIDEDDKIVKEKEQIFYVVPNGYSNDL